MAREESLRSTTGAVPAGVNASADAVEPIDPDTAILSLAPFRQFDADLTVAVREIDNSAVGISDAVLQIHVRDGGLLGKSRARLCGTRAPRHGAYRRPRCEDRGFCT